MKGNVKDLVTTLDGLYQITLTTENVKALELAKLLSGKPIHFTLDKWRKRRKKEENTEMWVLLTRLAEKLEVPKNSLYEQYLRRYGRHFDLTLRPCDAEPFRATWQKAGLGCLCDVLVPSVHGAPAIVRVWYGTSVYDAKAMAAFLRRLRAECLRHEIDADWQEVRDEG